MDGFHMGDLACEGFGAAVGARPLYEVAARELEEADVRARAGRDAGVRERLVLRVRTRVIHPEAQQEDGMRRPGVPHDSAVPHTSVGAGGGQVGTEGVRAVVAVTDPLRQALGVEAQVHRPQGGTAEQVRTQPHGLGGRTRLGRAAHEEHASGLRRVAFDQGLACADQEAGQLGDAAAARARMVVVDDGGSAARGVDGVVHHVVVGCAAGLDVAVERVGIA
ncbi:hypothetical protein ACU686_22005 [Yinghuangia aomiensis]